MLIQFLQFKRTNMSKPKFIIFDGVDACGKSTMINDLVRLDLQEGFGPFTHVREIKFSKLLSNDKPLIINDEKSFEIMFTLFDLLQSDTTYILDRFIMSNLVYDKIFRDEDVSLSLQYYNEFKTRYNVHEVILTRPHIKNDFEDDKIKMSKERFNLCIDEYHKYATNHQLLIRSENGSILGVNDKIYDKLFSECANFICHGKI